MLRKYTFETNLKRYLIGEHLTFHIEYYIRKVNKSLTNMILFVFVKFYSKKNSSMKLMCRRLLCATSKMCGDRNAQLGCSYHVLILCWRVTDWCTYSTAQRKYNTYNISRIYISGYFIVRVCFVVVMFLSIDSIDTAIKRTTIPFTWTSFVFVNILCISFRIKLGMYSQSIFLSGQC